MWGSECVCVFWLNQFRRFPEQRAQKSLMTCTPPPLQGVQVCLTSQCSTGTLQPALYAVSERRGKKGAWGARVPTPLLVDSPRCPGVMQTTPCVCDCPPFPYLWCGVEPPLRRASLQPTWASRPGRT